MDYDAYNEPVPIPRGGIRFPLELAPPPGFRPGDPATWPKAVGRLEYVGGRLLYMPPCGDDQQDVAASVVGILETWNVAHPQFIVGANEAGMILGGEIRGADAAVWRRGDLGERTGGYRRAAPVLAVEVAGRDEGEVELREKARWYFDHGVQLVWLVLPDGHEVVVLSPAAESRHRAGERLPEAAALPGLSPSVDQFFWKLG